MPRLCASQAKCSTLCYDKASRRTPVAVTVAVKTLGLKLMKIARLEGGHLHRQHIVSRSFPSDALLTYQNKFLECFDLIFSEALDELFENTFPLFRELTPNEFRRLEDDYFYLSYADLWRVFKTDNHIYPDSCAFAEEDSATQSARVAKKLIAWSETYRLKYDWVMGAALYIMSRWEREGVKEHRCGTLPNFLLKATRETRYEATYFPMIFELLPHYQAPWAALTDWLCYRSPFPLYLLLPELKFGFARPVPQMTKSRYLKALVPRLTEQVIREVEQSRWLRTFLYITDETRKAEWVDYQERFFLKHFGNYYDRVADYWRRMPDSDTIVPLGRREDPTAQMYWTVYGVVKSATPHEIADFVAWREELRVPKSDRDNIRKIVHDYCNVLQLSWTPKRGRPKKPEEDKKMRK